MTDEPVMRPEHRLEALSAEERHDFCRQVLESLSDIVAGDAPEAFCRDVDRLLGDCRPYLAFRATLEETIRATRELAALEPSGIEEKRFQHCIDEVRRALDRPSGTRPAS